MIVCLSQSQSAERFTSKYRTDEILLSDSTCSTAARVTSFRHSFIHSNDPTNDTPINVYLRPSTAQVSSLTV